jgi:lipopolysaccharide export system permease protein
MIRIYHRYILRRIIIAFVASVLIISLCLISLNLLRIIKNVKVGFSFLLFVTAVGYLNLFILAFSVPLSVLIAALLVYGRMSADNEITGLRASGVRIWQITLPVLIFSLIIGFLMLYINGIVSPEGHYNSSRITFLSRTLNPLTLFKPREPTDFGDYTILVDRVEGNKLIDISVMEPKPGKTATIKAKWGELISSSDGKNMRLDLHSTDITMHSDKSIIRERDRILSLEFDLTKILGKIQNKENVDDMTIKELLVRRKLYRNAAAAKLYSSLMKAWELTVAQESGNDKEAKERILSLAIANKEIEITSKEAGDMSARYLFEIYKRIVLSISCFIFAVIAAPLGIMAHRRERMVNVMIGAAIGLIYYAAIIVVEKSLHSEAIKLYLIWIPPAVLLLIGMLFYKRLGKGVS